MKNKNILTEKMTEIDGAFLDEYYNRKEERSAHKKRNTVIRYCGIAASLAVVIALSVVTLQMLKPDNVDDPNNVLDHPDNVQIVTKDDFTSDEEVHLKPIQKTVMYSKEEDFGLSEEELYTPPKVGKVRYKGELYTIMNDNELYENCIFAVKISFGAEFEPSVEYKKLITIGEYRQNVMFDRYENEYTKHIKQTHEKGYHDNTCDECNRLLELHQGDEAEINAIFQKADEVLRKDREVYAENVKELSDEYLGSIDFGFKDLTVIWSDSTESAEYAPVWKDIKIMHLTKDELASFEAPDNLGVEFTLIPEWMDVNEETVYRDIDLYPVAVVE